MHISRNTKTEQIAQGTLGKSFRQGDWVNCLNHSGSVKASQKVYIDADKLNKEVSNKLKEITVKKDLFIYENIDYNGSTFINSEKSGNNLQAAYNFGTFPVDWLDANGVVVSLSKIQIRELITLMMTKRSSAYMQEASLINQVNTAANLAALNLIPITFS